MAAPVSMTDPDMHRVQEVTHQSANGSPAAKTSLDGLTCKLKKGDTACWKSAKAKTFPTFPQARLPKRAPRRLTTNGLLMEAAHEIRGCTTEQFYSGAFPFGNVTPSQHHSLPRTENREPRTENREPRTENREPRTENRFLTHAQFRYDSKSQNSPYTGRTNPNRAHLFSQSGAQKTRVLLQRLEGNSSIWRLT